MSAGTGQTVSYWRAKAVRRERPPLREDLAVPVAVIGAGIAGLSVAYALARAGTPVCVIDRGSVGGGMTERTSAHLASAVDDRFKTIERRHGAAGAQICAASHREAIQFIADAVARENIGCAFERIDGYLFAGEGTDEEGLGDELEAARRAGLDVEWAERAPIAGFDTGRCLRFRGQAQFQPLDYVSGLADAIERLGGRVYCGTNAVAIDEHAPIRITTEAGHTILTGALVVATNTPINDRVAMHTKQAPYLTYVIAGRIPRAAVESGLFWDTEDPYHYVRSATGTDAAHRVLIVGGEDHKTGQQDDTDRFAALESWARRRFPSLSDITHRWSGQVLEPADGVAFIGRNPGSTDVYIATGDSGMGLTHGTIAGLLLPDLIQGRESPWDRLYSPSRKMLRAPLAYAKENLNVAARLGKVICGPANRDLAARVKELQEERVERIEKTIEVDRPVRMVYNQWTQFEQFPCFMDGVKEVKQLDDTHVHWRAEIWGQDKEWDAEITEQVPDEKIGWKSISGDAPNAGVVRFEPLGANKTRVRLVMAYEPQGALEHVGDALRVISMSVQTSIENFKSYIESRSHEDGAWRGSVHDSVARPPQRPS